MIKNQRAGTEGPACAGQFPTENRLPDEPVDSTTLELGDGAEASGSSAPTKPVDSRGPPVFHEQPNSWKELPLPGPVQIEETVHRVEAVSRPGTAPCARLLSGPFLFPRIFAAAQTGRPQAAGEQCHPCA